MTDTRLEADVSNHVDVAAVGIGLLVDDDFDVLVTIQRLKQFTKFVNSHIVSFGVAMSNRTTSFTF